VTCIDHPDPGLPMSNLSLPCRCRPILCLALFVLALPLPGSAQPGVAQLADLFTGINRAEGGEVRGAIGFDGRSFFTSRSREAGAELWVSDGTSAGTRLFADLCPGICSGSPAGFSVVGSRLYFSAEDRLHGRELWALDAGAQAPILVADIVPGADSSRPGLVRSVQFVVGGSSVTRVFTTATRPDVGTELFRVQGNSATLERDLRTGSASSNPSLPVSFGPNRLLVTAIDDSGERVPRVLTYATTTGLPGAPTALPGFTSGVPNLVLRPDVFRMADMTYLLRDGNGVQDELWIARDAGPGSERLLQRSNIDNPVLNFTLFRFFFTADTELHVSDGSVAGTVALGASGARQLVALGNRLLFLAGVSGGSANTELFRSDGTVAGTALLEEIFPGSGGLPSSARLHRSGDGQRVYLTQLDELWTSDGTSAGTFFVDRLPSDQDIDAFFPTLGRVALLSPRQGEPHISAGIPNDLRRLVDVIADVGHSFVAPVGVVGDRLVASALVDGTTTRTISLDADDGGAREILSERVARPIPALPLGGRLIVDLDDDVVLSTDGRASGSTLLPGPDPQKLIAVADGCGVVRGGEVFGRSETVGTGTTSQLWSSDGTLAGTRTLTALTETNLRFCNPRSISDIVLMAALGDGFILAGRFEGGAAGTEPLVFTPASGLQLLADIHPGGDSSNPTHLETLGDRVLFQADDGIHGAELWVTDGSAQGTRLLLDIEPGATGSRPRGVRRVGDRIVFAARTTQHGYELWSTDGTPAGTALVRDLFPGPGSGLAESFASGLQSPFLDANATHALFRGSPDPQSFERGCPVFVTDGTTAGTQCAQDRSLPVPTLGFAPASEARFASGGAIVFIAHTTVGGEEIHVLNRGGLVAIDGADVRPGSEGSGAQHLRVSGLRAWFAADDGISGIEPWRLDLAGLDTVFADGFEPR
jgi:ELWxxDGT repeat protein